MKTASLLRSLGAALSVGLCLSAAQAATVRTDCPGTTDTGDREFYLTFDNAIYTTGSISCYAFGPGNNPSTFPPYAFLDKDESPDTVVANDGWFTVTGLGGQRGTWTVSGDWAGREPLLLVLKSGEGQLNPDWAAFLIDNVDSGDWGIGNGDQSLSHASVYAGQGTTQVPSPGTLGLFGLGALGLGAATRRKGR